MILSSVVEKIVLSCIIDWNKLELTLHILKKQKWLLSSVVEKIAFACIRNQYWKLLKYLKTEWMFNDIPAQNIRWLFVQYLSFVKIKELHKRITLKKLGSYDHCLYEISYFRTSISVLK